MSAPITDLPSSISSSGHVDGLGRRLLAFDRETGAILERLHLRPELAAFEAAIRDRVEQLAAFDDERFARPASVERDPATGDLTVLSEFVAGSRLSDLLETAEEAGLVPGVDVALGFLLEALPAISSFHTATGCSHGLIDPARMVITPAGQVVFLDVPFGSVTERLGLSPARLWVELGIASARGGERARLDTAADIAQVALSAVMLVIGRRLRADEYPEAIGSLLMEVVEVAQIRGSSHFAATLQRLLQRSLPLPGRRPYNSAEELAAEIRILLRREIGADVCRQALIDFTEQMDAAFPGARFDTQPHSLLDAGPCEEEPALDLDGLTMEALDSIEVLDGDDAAVVEPEETEDAGGDFEEISLESDSLRPTEFHVPSPHEAAETFAIPAEAPKEATGTAAAVPTETGAELKPIEDPWRFDPMTADQCIRDEEPAATDATAPSPTESGFTASDTLSGDDGADEDTDAAESADEPGSESSSDGLEIAASAEAGSTSSRRKKRQHKSVRARKDKLRSAAEIRDQTPAKPAETRTQSGWLVSPDRATAFAPPIPDSPAPVAPVAPMAPPAPPAMPVYAAAPAPPAMPVYPTPTGVPPAAVVQPPHAAIPMPVYGAPTPVAPPPPAPAAAAPKAAAPANVPLRLKAEPPPGYAPPRPSGVLAPPPSVQRQMFEAKEARGFPWKLAVAAVLIVGIAVVVGRAYIPSRGASGEPPATAAAPPPEPAPPAAAPKADTGEIVVETQPAGARVLLDGKPVGQSPLTLRAVPEGRHVLTFVSSSGEVTRTVRVAGGKSVPVDVSIFSGWVAVFAPVVLQVSVNGRALGTTEQDRLMLPPGRHELTLTNKALGYKAVKEVEVEPGEVRSVNVDARGPASFNATPWAEVWMDGQKLGDTPLANVRVPLGTREFVFRNPQYGERKVTASIRADQPSAIGVDFTRPQ